MPVAPKQSDSRPTTEVAACAGVVRKLSSIALTASALSWSMKPRTCSSTCARVCSAPRTAPSRAIASTSNGVSENSV